MGQGASGSTACRWATQQEVEGETLMVGCQGDYLRIDPIDKRPSRRCVQTQPQIARGHSRLLKDGQDGARRIW
jgi:hypothetical protein